MSTKSTNINHATDGEMKYISFPEQVQMNLMVRETHILVLNSLTKEEVVKLPLHRFSLEDDVTNWSHTTFLVNDAQLSKESRCVFRQALRSYVNSRYAPRAGHSKISSSPVAKPLFELRVELSAVSRTNVICYTCIGDDTKDDKHAKKGVDSDDSKSTDISC